MTTEEAYLQGFCKAAEAMGVNPVELVKATKGAAPASTNAPAQNAFTSMLGKLKGRMPKSPSVKLPSSGSVTNALNRVGSVTNALPRSAASATNMLSSARSRFDDMLKALRARSASTNAAPAATAK